MAQSVQTEVDMNEQKEHRHPSYGMIQVNRRTHNRGTYLFGSSVVDHYQTFSLSIHHGMAIEDEVGTGAQRFCNDGHVAIVEVEMSAAQFIELLTTHNVGDGVPCTINRIGMLQVADPPRPTTDVERAHGAFENRMREFGKRLDGFVDDVEKAAAKLPKKDQGGLKSAAERLRTEVASNIPFFLRTFTEAADRIVSAKKCEVEAWLSAVVRSAGLQHLRALAPKSAEADPLMLPVRADDDTVPPAEEG